SIFKCIQNNGSSKVLITFLYNSLYSSSVQSFGAFNHNGFVSFIGVVSTTSSSFVSSVFIVSKYISTGKNEQYLSIIFLTVYSSKNSLLSSAKNNVIVVPLVFLLSDCVNSNSNPSSLT